MIKEEAKELLAILRRPSFYFIVASSAVTLVAAPSSGAAMPVVFTLNDRFIKWEALDLYKTASGSSGYAMQFLGNQALLHSMR